MATIKLVARIIAEATGYHISNDALPYADCRGTGYRSHREAVAMARDYGYTHLWQASGRVVSLESRR